MVSSPSVQIRMIGTVPRTASNAVPPTRDGRPAPYNQRVAHQQGQIAPLVRQRSDRLMPLTKSATASAPAGMWSGADGSVTVCQTASAASVAVVIEAGCSNQATAAISFPYAMKGSLMVSAQGEASAAT